MDPGLIVFNNKVLCEYPMAHLQGKEFTCRVNCYGLVYEAVHEGVPEIMEFSWVY